jgi:hypothetical protein
MPNFSTTASPVYMPFFPPEESEQAPVVFPPNVKSLDHWGSAIITYGSHKGKRYHDVYDIMHYRQWINDHKSQLTCPGAIDFSAYVTARQSAMRSPQ